MPNGITIKKIDTTLFQRGLNGLFDQVQNGPKVLRKEVGELQKTLVRLTPAGDGKKIAKNISGKFEMLANEGNSSFEGRSGGKQGNGGIIWYSVTEQFLRGIAPANDKREASVEELKQLSYHVTRHGRLSYPIKGHRSQKALILQTILTRKKTVDRLIAAKKQNRGRLKAGWIVAATAGVAPMTGGNQPPQFVKRHAAGARGYFVNGLGDKQFPKFTIANYAAGTGNKTNNLDAIVQAALNVRGRAMLANANQYHRGKKKLSDYAK